MSKMVCVKCQTELKPETNGVLLIEMAYFGPYKVWYADAWKCPGCGAEVIEGFANHPLRQDHYAKDFPAWLENEKKIAVRVIYDYERPRVSGEYADNNPNVWEEE